MPIQFVWTPDTDHFPDFDIATYGEIEEEPGSYELQWFT